MVEACRVRFGETKSQRFQCLDARDLSAFADAAFDLILFSFNGIDYVDLPGRERVLSEVKRLLRPEGLFFFSSHSLAALPWTTDFSGLSLAHPGYAILLARRVLFEQRRRWANRGIDLVEAKKRGWAYLQDGAHGFGLATFYGLPGFQVGQLHDRGLRTQAMFGVDGRELKDSEEPRDMMIHYLCGHADEGGSR
jgi:SAM-dependent methyltransferase